MSPERAEQELAEIEIKRQLLQIEADEIIAKCFAYHKVLPKNAVIDFFQIETMRIPYEVAQTIKQHYIGRFIVLVPTSFYAHRYPKQDTKRLPQKLIDKLRKQHIVSNTTGYLVNVQYLNAPIVI